MMNMRNQSCDINLANRLLHACVRFVTDLANLFTARKISGRAIGVKYKQFKTICEQTSENSPTDSSSSCLK